VLTAREAKQVALRQGFAPWIERVRLDWHLGWQHIDIDPGDVVTIALEDGRSFVVRVLEIDIGANLELVWKTVVQESASYGVATLTSGGVIYRRAIASPSAASRLLIADSPLLADGDDALRRSSGLY
jgi:Putative phage tail protein